jgi:hypothetical protein
VCVRVCSQQAVLCVLSAVIGWLVSWLAGWLARVAHRSSDGSGNGSCTCAVCFSGSSTWLPPLLGCLLLLLLAPEAPGPDPITCISLVLCPCVAAAGPRPDRLRAEVARQAMPSSSAAGGGTGRLGAAGSHGPVRGLEVVAAHYSNGVLLLAEAAAGESRTRLFMLSRCERFGGGGGGGGGGVSWC